MKRTEPGSLLGGKIDERTINNLGALKVQFYVIEKAILKDR